MEIIDVYLKLMRGAIFSRKFKLPSEDGVWSWYKF